MIDCNITRLGRAATGFIPKEAGESLTRDRWSITPLIRGATIYRSTCVNLQLATYLPTYFLSAPSGGDTRSSTVTFMLRK
jgi:hypothetical protein